MEYQSTTDHRNTDALSHLPVGDDDFGREEERADVSIVCNVRELSHQLNPAKPKLIARETAKDQVLSKVQSYTKEVWLSKLADEMKQFQKLEDSLVVESGCHFYGAYLIIPDKLGLQVLELHLGYFRMQRMKQLERSVVYWPHIDDDIEKPIRTCTFCAEHQNKPPKSANHP